MIRIVRSLLFMAYLAVALLSLSCKRKFFVQGEADPSAVTVSLQDLLAQAEKYDGKIVRTEGILYLQLHVYFLYEGELSLSVSRPELSDDEISLIEKRRVWIEGRYDSSMPGGRLVRKGGIFLTYISLQ